MELIKYISDISNLEIMNNISTTYQSHRYIQSECKRTKITNYLPLLCKKLNKKLKQFVAKREKEKMQHYEKSDFNKNIKYKKKKKY